MKIKILFHIASLVLSLTISAQKNIQESIYLQLNDNFLLTGETLYFSAFCNSEATGLPSPLSQILYVEMIGEGEKVVFQQKIALTNSRGGGDFFISSLVPTGTYQLIAYTRWMKNFGKYFSAKVEIVNPFEEYQAPDRAEKLTISFFPEGGHLIPDVENDIAIQINRKESMSGRVTNEAGDKVAKVTINANGLGRFELTPLKSELYQLILEDQSGNFHFTNLPLTSPDKAIIHLTNLPGTYELEVFGKTGPNTELLLTNGQNIIFEQKVKKGQKYSFPKRALRHGVYKAFLKHEETEVSSRLIFHHAGLKQNTISEINKYGKRSLVQEEIEVSEDARVSISVRKVSEFGKEVDAVSHELLKHLTGLADWTSTDTRMLTSEWKYLDGTPSWDTVKWLPEHRGKLVSGHIDPAIAKQVLTHSIVGESYLLNAAITDENGSFIFQVEARQGGHEAFLSAIDADTSFTFQLDNPFLEAYPAFDYSPPRLDSAQAAQLTERSIRNQIENAYYDAEENAILTEEITVDQFPVFDYYYELDDYNRFPEMHEHFIEYIPTVVARKSQTRSKMKVILDKIVIGEYEPLLLLDGLPVSTETILSFSPYKIKSIGVINNRIFLGPLVADGLVMFETFEHNLMGVTPESGQQRYAYQGLEKQKIYSFTEYQTPENFKNIPDYREQLYWNPGASLSSTGHNVVDFYTSDVSGKFEIAIDGYTTSGLPVSIRKYFIVEQQPD